MNIVGVIPNHILRQMPRADRDALGKRGQTYEEAQIKLAAREEKELQRQLANLFALHGIIANRSRMDRKKTDMVGWPDFVMGIHGEAIAMEAKRPGEKLDEEQIKVREKMESNPNRWRYYVIHSVAEAVTALRELKVIR